MKTTLFIAAFMLPCIVKAQDEDHSKWRKPYVYNDTLYTTCGYNIGKGQDVRIGTGSTPDGDFKFIRINSASLFNSYSTTGHNAAANNANAFSRSQSGYKYEVKKVMARGNDAHGYVCYAKIGTGIVNYEIDVERAIASGELEVPVKYQPKPVNTTSTESVADQLTKLKALLDSGALTQEEYDQQKKKLLSQ